MAYRDKAPDGSRSPPPNYATHVEACAYRHLMLASVVEADRARPLPKVTLYHCCHEHQLDASQQSDTPSTVPVRVIDVFMSPDALAGVQGFTGLDTVCLAGDLDVAVALSERLEATPDMKLFELVQQLPEADQGTFVQFVAFSVYSDSPDDVVAEGRVPVWKWTKPTSPYGAMNGLWETELHQVLEDGSWRGGKELVLLVRGISEQERQAMRSADLDMIDDE